MSLKLTGKRLRALRKNKDLSQKELSEKLGISVASISHYENNDKKPKSELIIKLSNFYNVSADYILGLSDIKDNADYLLKQIQEKTKIKINIETGDFEVQGTEEFVKEQIKNLNKLRK